MDRVADEAGLLNLTGIALYITEFKIFFQMTQ